jgi:hypothetical protein
MERILFKDGSYIEIKKDDITGETNIELVFKSKKEFKLKNGDFLFEDGRIMIVKSYPSNYHALIYPVRDDKVQYNRRYGLHFSHPSFRYATEVEKHALLDAIRKDGKYWDEDNKCIKDIPSKDFVPKDGDYVTIEYSGDSNFEPDCETNKVVGILRGKLCKGNNGFPFYAGINLSGELCLYGSFGNNEGDISRPSTEEERKELLDMLEDFAFWEKADKKGGDDKTKNPQRKFKTGDKVRIKDGISSETHFSDSFVPGMDKFLGKVLTIKGYVADGDVDIMEDPNFFWFSEEWLEPCIEEIKQDDCQKLQSKFKIGDKVRIKDGISSETHFYNGFIPQMDILLGKVLTIKECIEDKRVSIEEDYYGLYFSEDWLEPVPESIKIGDWVIYFPDENKKLATVGILSDVVIHDGKLGFLIDNKVFVQQIIKWEGTKEQLENVRKGES